MIQSAMTTLTEEKAKIETQMKALRILVGIETDPEAPQSVGFVARIKEILTEKPGTTSTEITKTLNSCGYVRPRAGGRIKKYDVPIALGRLTKTGQVVRVGGNKAVGFKYAVKS